VSRNYAPTIKLFHVDGIVMPNQPVGISVTAEDKDNDPLDYEWTFTDPPATTRSGNPVIVSPTTSQIKGSVTVTDGRDGIVTKDIPKVVISSPLNVTTVVGQPFSYTPTAMANGPVVITIDTELSAGLSYVGGVLTGTITTLGTYHLQISAVGSEGTDVQDLWITAAIGVIPAPPTNLLVKGSRFPTWRTGDSITVTWSVGDVKAFTVLHIYPIGDQTLKLSVKLDPGVTGYTFENAELVAALTTEQDFVLRAYSSDGAQTINRNYIEISVDFLG